MLGATSGIVAAPCGAPAFAVVLTWVTTTQSGVLGFIYLFVFSLGMTALLVLVGLFSGSLAALPKAGAWMVWVKKIAGVLMLYENIAVFRRHGNVKPLCTGERNPDVVQRQLELSFKVPAELHHLRPYCVQVVTVKIKD